MRNAGRIKTPTKLLRDLNLSNNSSLKRTHTACISIRVKIQEEFENFKRIYAGAFSAQLKLQQIPGSCDPYCVC